MAWELLGDRPATTSIFNHFVSLVSITLSSCKQIDADVVTIVRHNISSIFHSPSTPSPLAPFSYFFKVLKVLFDCPSAPPPSLTTPTSHSSPFSIRGRTFLLLDHN